MRSSISLRKAFLQTWKKQLWVSALSCLAFFVSCPVWFLMRFGSWEQMEYSAQEMRNLFETAIYGYGYMGASEMTLFMLSAIMIACISAWNGFSYLHNRIKTDFYHALPLKREKLFLLQFLTALVNYIVPAAAGLILILVTGSIRGLVTRDAVTGMAGVFAVGMVFYLLCYLTAVLAMLLTGRLLVGMLGTAVFFGIGPLMFLVLEGYVSTFFTTGGYSHFWGAFSRIRTLELSPMGAGLYAISSLAYVRALHTTLAAAAADVILIILNVLIYRKRPSQSAEKAMAFRIPGEVIIIWLTVVGALTMGLFFRSTGVNQDGWTLFGLIFGVLLIYAVIRMIYYLDIRRVLSGKWQLAACFVLAFLVAGIFRFDLLGYDAYIPDSSRIESIGFGREAVFNGMDEASRFSGANLMFPCNDTTYELLERLVSGHKIFKQTFDNTADNSPETSYQQVYVRLKNGNSYSRYYEVYAEDVKTQLAALYDQEEFRQKIYEPLYQDISMIGEIRINYPEQRAADGEWRSDDQSVTGKKTREELIEAIKYDLAHMSGSTLLEEPVVCDIAAEVEFSGITYENSDTLLSDSDMERLTGNGVNILPLHVYIYPSFEKTLGVLKENGYRINPWEDPDKVTAIDLYDEAGNSNRITDPERISALLAGFTSTDYRTLWQAGDTTASLICRDDDGSENEYYGSVKM